jgi:hypothetical protein
MKYAKQRLNDSKAHRYSRLSQRSSLSRRSDRPDVDHADGGSPVRDAGCLGDGSQRAAAAACARHLFGIATCSSRCQTNLTT